MEVSGQMMHLSSHFMPAVPVLQDELCTRDLYLCLCSFRSATMLKVMLEKMNGVVDVKYSMCH